MEGALTQIDLFVPTLKAAVISLALAVLTLIIGWSIAAVAGRAVLRVANRSPHVDRTVVPMVYTITVWSIRLIVVIAVLARLGIQTASIIAVLGAAGVAVGLALQGTLQNIAAGIMLLALRPLRAGENISVVGKAQGKVEEVGLFLTRFQQDDGTYLSLPNSLVWGNPIINYSRNGVRRLDFSVAIRYDDDLQRALLELTQVVQENAWTLKDPPPKVFVNEYRDVSVIVVVRVWTRADDYGSLRTALYEEALRRLGAAGIRPAG